MRRLNWLLLSVMLLGIVGCSEKGPERIGLSGHVTYNGKPIEEGEIAFYPEEGSKASPTSTLIVKGNYKLPQNWAIIPATYTVSVLSYKPQEANSKPIGDGVANPQAAVGIVVRDQLLPEKCNK
ncbi:MAG: hypothetical protein V4719_28850, partial [Planctomycetota bacterium]